MARDDDGLVLPGGVGNPDTLRQDEDAVEFVKAFFEAGKGGTTRPSADRGYDVPPRGGGSSVGRAPGCGPGGRGFESPPPPCTGFE
jgi:hypothetical protein